MLRRVARVLRLVLLCLGLALGVWLPVTHWVASSLAFTWGKYEVWLYTVPSSARATIFDHSPFDLGMGLQIEEADVFSARRQRFFVEHLFPGIHREGSIVYLRLPLWLLAGVCLAWPVTSLLVRRRRRGRGFEVEAEDGGAVSTADS